MTTNCAETSSPSPMMRRRRSPGIDARVDGCAAHCRQRDGLGPGFGMVMVMVVCLGVGRDVAVQSRSRGRRAARAGQMAGMPRAEWRGTTLRAARVRRGIRGSAGVQPLGHRDGSRTTARPGPREWRRAARRALRPQNPAILPARPRRSTTRVEARQRARSRSHVELHRRGRARDLHRTPSPQQRLLRVHRPDHPHLRPSVPHHHVPAEQSPASSHPSASSPAPHEATPHSWTRRSLKQARQVVLADSASHPDATVDDR